MTNVIEFPTQALPGPSESQLVFEFMTAMGQIPDTPLALYGRLVQEETIEVIEAAAHLLKELSDLKWVSMGYQHLGGDIEETFSIIEAHIDAELLHDLYEAFGPEREEEAFIRLYGSNMSKLVNGKPLLREDGKVLKGPNYKPADLTDLIAL